MIRKGGRTDGWPGVLKKASFNTLTRHKYIIIGTKILGQIVDEPIEEGQHIKAGDVLARIDDRDYQAQLRQSNPIRDVAKANLHLLQDKTDRARRLKEMKVGFGNVSNGIGLTHLA